MQAAPNRQSERHYFRPITYMTAYLTEPVAQQIVQRAMNIIPHNVNVMDRAGIIIGTGFPERKHQVHAGALKVLESGQAFDIDASQATRLKGVQAGINRPIRFRREIIGVVGVTGAPEAVSQERKCGFRDDPWRSGSRRPV